jgi:hypothetical protein
MQAETRGTIVLSSGQLLRAWEHSGATWSLRGGAGAILGSFLALAAIVAVLLASSSPAPAGSGARPSFTPGSAHPVADPHGVRPSLLRTTG